MGKHEHKCLAAQKKKPSEQVFLMPRYCSTQVLPVKIKHVSSISPASFDWEQGLMKFLLPLTYTLKQQTCSQPVIHKWTPVQTMILRVGDYYSYPIAMTSFDF